MKKLRIKKLSLLKSIVMAAVIGLGFMQSAVALTLGEIGAALPNDVTHSVLFSQHKFLKDANITLDSKGKILSIKDKGILIRQSSPYPMELVVKKDSITEYSNGEIHSIKANDNPAIHSLLKLLLKLMHPDEGLKEDFDYRIDGNEDRYTVRLHPKDRNLQKFFNEISFEGAKHINKLVIKGAHGDITTMELSGYDFSKKAVTPKDLKYFD